MTIIAINQAAQMLTFCGWCARPRSQGKMVAVRTALENIGWRVSDGICPACKAQFIVSVNSLGKTP